MKCCLLVYDVPTGAKIVHPSRVMRSLGARINLSAWIIPENRIPFDYFEEIAAVGVEWQVVQFDEKEKDKIMKLAENAIREEIHEILHLFSKSCTVASEMKAKAEAGKDPNDKRDMRVYQALNRAKKYLVAAEEAAIAFDLLASVDELLEGTRVAVAAKSEVAFATIWGASLPTNRGGAAKAAANAKAKAATKAKALKAHPKVVERKKAAPTVGELLGDLII